MANPATADYDGRTPLHVAASRWAFVWFDRDRCRCGGWKRGGGFFVSATTSFHISDPPQVPSTAQLSLPQTQPATPPPQPPQPPPQQTPQQGRYSGPAGHRGSRGRPRHRGAAGGRVGREGQDREYPTGGGGARGPPGGRLPAARAPRGGASIGARPPAAVGGWGGRRVWERRGQALHPGQQRERGCGEAAGWVCAAVRAAALCVHLGAPQGEQWGQWGVVDGQAGVQWLGGVGGVAGWGAGGERDGG